MYFHDHSYKIALGLPWAEALEGLVYHDPSSFVAASR